MTDSCDSSSTRETTVDALLADPRHVDPLIMFALAMVVFYSLFVYLLVCRFKTKLLIQTPYFNVAGTGNLIMTQELKSTYLFAFKDIIGYSRSTFNEYCI